MTDYKVIFRADETSGSSTLLWEPGCPCLLEAVQISRNIETAQAYLQIKVGNVTNSQINSIYGIATVYYGNSTFEDVSFEDLDADILFGQKKVLRAVSLPSGDIVSATVKLTHIKQTDKTWETCSDPATIPHATQLELNHRANTERLRLLSEYNIDTTSHIFSVQDNGDWWICSCGQLNIGPTTCCKCGVNKNLIKLFSDESDLLTSADKWARSVYNQAMDLASSSDDIDSLQKALNLFSSIEDWKDSVTHIESCGNRIAELKRQTAEREEQEKRHKRKKRSRIIILIISAIVIIISVLLIINVIIPVYHAKELYQQGHIFEALEILDAL